MVAGLQKSESQVRPPPETPGERPTGDTSDIRIGCERVPLIFAQTSVEKSRVIQVLWRRIAREIDFVVVDPEARAVIDQDVSSDDTGERHV